MNYIKAKYPNQSRSYTFKTSDSVSAGDTVVTEKGAKLTVVGEADMAWVETYGVDNVVVVKKYDDPAVAGEKKGIKMFLYKFELDMYSKVPKITMKKIEVEEKPKTYYPKESWSSRILKDEIGRITGYFKNEVYLLENNFDMAKELFVGKVKSNISWIKSEIDSKQNELSNTERKLEILEQLSGIESEEN